MRANDTSKIQYAEYSGSTFFFQTIICIVILLSILGLEFFGNDFISKIDYYLHEDIEWQVIYEALLQVKEILLHYIR